MPVTLVELPLSVWTEVVPAAGELTVTLQTTVGRPFSWTIDSSLPAAGDVVFDTHVNQVEPFSVLLPSGGGLYCRPTSNSRPSLVKVGS